VRTEDFLLFGTLVRETRIITGRKTDALVASDTNIHYRYDGLWGRWAKTNVNLNQETAKAYCPDENTKILSCTNGYAC